MKTRGRNTVQIKRDISYVQNIGLFGIPIWANQQLKKNF